MGRKKLNRDLGRNVRLHIRLTPGEKTRLLEQAGARNETVSDHVRRIALHSPPTIRRADPERSALIRGLGELGKIGSNVNQIAHELHRARVAGYAPNYSENDVWNAMQGIRQVSDHLHNLLSNDHERQNTG